MKKNFFISLLLLFFVGCSPISESETTSGLTISAAASMMDSLLEIEEMFTKEHPNVQVSYNFGGSGSLRKQIEQGAPIDLFFSASKTDYEKLVNENLIEKGTSLLENELVFIKSKHSKVHSFNDFLRQDAMMAIGTPKVVPAGTYAKEVLEKMEVWSKLQNRIVFAKDVSQVLAYVREGAVDAGIVYATDVLNIDDVTILETFDRKLHSPIKYYVAIINNHKRVEGEQIRELFYQFIRDKSALEVFKRHGFYIEE